MGGAERTRGARGHERHGVEDGQHAATRDILRYSRYLVVERKERVRASVVERWCGRRYRCLLAQSPRRRVWYAFWRAAFGHGYFCQSPPVVVAGVCIVEAGVVILVVPAANDASVCVWR